MKNWCAFDPQTITAGLWASTIKSLSCDRELEPSVFVNKAPTASHIRSSNPHTLYFERIFLLGLVLTYYAGDKIEKNEMGRACDTYGGKERCAQGFGGET